MELILIAHKTITNQTRKINRRIPSIVKELQNIHIIFTSHTTSTLIQQQKGQRMYRKIINTI